MIFPRIKIEGLLRQKIGPLKQYYWRGCNSFARKDQCTGEHSRHSCGLNEVNPKGGAQHT